MKLYIFIFRLNEKEMVSMLEVLVRYLFFRGCKINVIMLLGFKDF